MSSNVSKELIDAREKTYADFRTLLVDEQLGEFSPEQIEVFRRVLFDMVVASSSDYGYTTDIHDIQMSAEFFISVSKQREVMVLPKDFNLDGKLEIEPKNYSYYYQLFTHILQSRSKVNLCFMLPFFGFYKSKGYQITKADIPRLERFAFTFWNTIRHRQISTTSTRVDLIYDFIDVSEVLRFIINYTFSDKSSKSEHVVDRTLTLLKEIAVCWGCAVLDRTKIDATTSDIVNNIFTKKIKQYHKIASQL